MMAKTNTDLLKRQVQHIRLPIQSADNIVWMQEDART